MTRSIPALVAAMVVVGTLAAFPAVAIAADTETPTDAANATVDPGAQLAGVVDVQQAELDGEVETRAYGIEIAQAQSNESRAEIVAERVADIQERMETLEQRREELDDARANGSMNESEYRARMAGVHARGQTVQRMANRTNHTASELPADVLEANGVNVSAIQSLQDRAGELTGAEVAEIARGIAGENAGQAPGADEARERGDDRRGGEQAGGDDRPAGNETDGQDAQPTDGGAPDWTETENATTTPRDAQDDGNTTGQDRRPR